MRRISISLLIIWLFISCLNAESNVSSVKYTIKKGDILSIYVMDNPEFTFKDLIVMPDGLLQYPSIGSIEVEGLTLDELKLTINDVVSQYISNPVITVFVSKLFNYNISIIGYVYKPGTYQVFEPIDLLYALSLAGGIRESKDCKINVIRANGSSETLRLKNLINPNAKNSQVLVHPFDTVIVDQPRSLNWAVVTACISAGALISNIYINFK